MWVGPLRAHHGSQGRGIPKACWRSQDGRRRRKDGTLVACTWYCCFELLHGRSRELGYLLACYVPLRSSWLTVNAIYCLVGRLVAGQCPFHTAITSSPNLSARPWDICAGTIIAQEAGGMAAGSHSSPLDNDVNEEILNGRKYIVIRCIGDTAVCNSTAFPDSD